MDPGGAGGGARGGARGRAEGRAMTSPEGDVQGTRQSQVGDRSLRVIAEDGLESFGIDIEAEVRVDAASCLVQCIIAMD